MAKFVFILMLSFGAVTSFASTIYEVEPNDNLNEANRLGIKQTLVGQLYFNQDQDWFRIENPPVGGVLAAYLNCSYFDGKPSSNPFVLSFYSGSGQLQALHTVRRADCVNRNFRMNISFPTFQDYFLVVSAGGDYIDTNYTIRVGAPVVIGNPQVCPTGQRLFKQYRTAPGTPPSDTDPNGSSDWQAWFHTYCPGYTNPSACKPYTYVCR